MWFSLFSLAFVESVVTWAVTQNSVMDGVAVCNLTLQGAGFDA